MRIKELMPEVVVVRFPKSLVAALKEKQDAVGVSMSEQIRRYVTAALKAESIK